METLTKIKWELQRDQGKCVCVCVCDCVFYPVPLIGNLSTKLQRFIKSPSSVFLFFFFCYLHFTSLCFLESTFPCALFSKVAVALVNHSVFRGQAKKT